MKINVILPARGEAENLEALLPELHGILAGCGADYTLTVIDAPTDGDDSRSVCERNGAEYIIQSGKGYADAFRDGISVSEGDRLLVVDADLSQDISKIPDMISAAEAGADVVIGSRYCPGGKSEDRPLSVVMSRMLNAAYAFFLGLGARDVSTDFRLYRLDMLRSVSTSCSMFDVIEETLFLLKKQYPDIRIVEVPIRYGRRAAGKSKRKTAKLIASYIALLARLTLKKQ